MGNVMWIGSGNDCDDISFELDDIKKDFDEKISKLAKHCSDLSESLENDKIAITKNNIKLQLIQDGIKSINDDLEIVNVNSIKAKDKINELVENVNKLAESNNKAANIISELFSKTTNLTTEYNVLERRLNEEIDKNHFREKFMYSLIGLFGVVCIINNILIFYFK